MPSPSPAITLAESEWLDPEYAPTKPWLVASARMVRPALAPAPWLLVTPRTDRAASSAISACSRRRCGETSAPSSRSSFGRLSVSKSASGASPAYASSGASCAIATTRSASAVSAAGEKSAVDALAERLPTNTRTLISSLSERSTSSSAPSRIETCVAASPE